MLTRKKIQVFFSQDAIVNAVAEFNYMPEEEVIFFVVFQSIRRPLQNGLYQFVRPQKVQTCVKETWRCRTHEVRELHITKKIVS